MRGVYVILIVRVLSTVCILLPRVALSGVCIPCERSDARDLGLEGSADLSVDRPLRGHERLVDLLGQIRVDGVAASSGVLIPSDSCSSMTEDTASSNFF